MRNGLLSCKGSTLLELVVATFITSIIVSATYKTWDYFTVSTEHEKKKASIQQDIIYTMEKMGHDVRMSGIGLPGNGIQATLSDTSNDEIQVFMNEAKAQTKLTANLTYSQVKILVTDASGASSDGWVCIAGAGLDTIYRAISGLGMCNTGPDTVYLNGIVGAGTFTIASTDIYFCKRSGFKIVKNAKLNKLVYTRNNLDVPVCDNIDTLNITPKSSTGAIITGSLKNAAVIEVFTGGYVGSGPSKVLISEKMEINIRNGG